MFYYTWFETLETVWEVLFTSLFEERAAVTVQYDGTCKTITAAIPMDGSRIRDVDKSPPGMPGALRCAEKCIRRCLM